MYIWEKEIKEVQDGIIIFIDWTSTSLSEKYLKLFQSDESVKNKDFFDKATAEITADILKTLADSSCDKFMINRVLSELWIEIAKLEKNVMCDIFKTKSYEEISFWDIYKKALELDNENFIN